MEVQRLKGVKKIIVTTEDGAEHVFDGSKGSVLVSNTSDGKEIRPETWQTVTAHMRLKETE